MNIGNENNILFYNDKEGNVRVEVIVQDENVWLNTVAIAKLFNVDRSVITKHINNIYLEEELFEKATCAKIAQVQQEGKRNVTRQISYYNLDMIISIGFRVNSKKAIKFRTWANKIIKEYMIIGYNLDVERFKNNGDNSYFEYELCLNEHFYSYGFEIHIPKRQIVSEWLIDMTKKNPKVIFERDINKEYYYPDNLNKKYSNFENCLSEMRANTNDLFLKEMNRRLMMSKNNDEYYLDIKSVYKFLMYDTTIIRPSTHKLFGMDYIKNKDKIIDILNKLDINIVDIIEEKSSLDMIYAKMSNLDFSNFMDELNNLLSKFNNLKCTLRIENDLYTIKREKDEYKVSSLKFKHANSNDSFGAYEESDGTIRILELIDILLTNHKLFLIDELDSSLHPVLVDGLLKIFLSSKKTNQLIITTHESKTLDFDLVRRDEIWFSEKNKKGASRIYSLEEYKDVARFDKKIDKAYLEGRFGAVAQIDTNYED